tara:strand:- start:163 stop:606 length:444 start_codon:yes stop_codon:yes gene_type:complete
LAKSQQTFNKLEREKNRAKKREVKRKKMAARREAKARGEYKQDEFVYVDYNGNFTETPPDPAEKEQISLESIVISPTKKEELDSRVQGKVTFYDEEKGFGFIKNPLNQDSYFFHFSECEDLLSVGDKVEFELIRGEKGMNAVKIIKQ